ncbi:MAG: dethiobiotin synthase [Cyclobacteriaceae bacterium]|nr:dethiobiotin synthase [Cyclobacteriaceae bacterium]MCH8517920.1 dethiobiotin synthase [Cyclobacteriaceae bacterium]
MNKQAQYFMTAIGTDSGKTFVSALLCEALGWDYWKPIQAGAPTDTSFIKQKVRRKDINIHPEQYILKMPASPHAAAADESIEISWQKLPIINTPNPLLIEGAGGLMVPINDRQTMIDFPLMHNLPVILVSNHYLGSINHTLLSIEALKSRGLNLRLLVLNGEPTPGSESAILKYAQADNVLKIPKINSEEEYIETIERIKIELGHLSKR